MAGSQPYKLIDLMQADEEHRVEVLIASREHPKQASIHDFPRNFSKHECITSRRAIFYTSEHSLQRSRCKAFVQKMY